MNSGNKEQPWGASRLVLAHSALTSADIGKGVQVNSGVAELCDGTYAFQGTLTDLDSTQALVRRLGVANVSQLESALVPGALYYVDTLDGSYTATIPTSNQGKLLAGCAASQNEIALLWSDEFMQCYRPSARSVTLTASSGSAASLPKDATLTGYVDAVRKPRYIEIQPAVTFGGSPDGNVEVTVYKSIDGGATYETTATWTLSIDYATSTSKNPTYILFGVTGAKIVLTNKDTTDAITSCSINHTIQY